MVTAVNLQVPRRAQSLIIGKGRKTVTEIMEETGAEVFVPPRDLASSVVTIRGDPDSVKEAQEKIEHILGYELDEAELSVAYVSVPKPEHSSLIGLNGATLKDLRKQCGCHIHVPRVRDREKNVEIHGSEAAIELAQSKIEAILGHPVVVSRAGPVIENRRSNHGPGEESPSDSSPNGSDAKQPRSRQAKSKSARRQEDRRERSAPKSPNADAATGKRRLDKGRINDVLFFPSTDPDPLATVLQYISNASLSVHLLVSILDNQKLVVLLQNLLSQNVAVSIIIKNNIPGSNLSEARTLQSLGAQVKVDTSSQPSYLNFAVVDGALAVSGTHTWTKAGSLHFRQAITVTNHRDFVRSYKDQFTQSFQALGAL